MRRTFLGTGWDFLGLVEPPATGEVRTAHEEESVRQAVWLILGTARGERVMRPDFGCGIHELVFSVGGSTLAGQVVREVKEALLLWEPRIDVLDVRAGDDPATPATLLIEIEYRVRTTNNQFNLVYPFYLERSAS